LAELLRMMDARIAAQSTPSSRLFGHADFLFGRGEIRKSPHLKINHSCSVNDHLPA